MSTQVVGLTPENLQAWSNDPDAAKHNLPAIFAGLQSSGTLAEWATEALENCGPPLESDLAFLAKATADHAGDTSYWACKLIGRSGAAANAFQESLTAVLLCEKASQAARQQAALSLSSIGSLTSPSIQALRDLTGSSDPRLARIAKQAIGSSK